MGVGGEKRGGGFLALLSVHMEKTKSLEVPKEIQYLTTKVETSFVDLGKCCFKSGSSRHIGKHRIRPQVAATTEYTQSIAMSSF